MIRRIAAVPPRPQPVSRRACIVRNGCSRCRIDHRRLHDNGRRIAALAPDVTPTSRPAALRGFCRADRQCQCRCRYCDLCNVVAIHDPLLSRRLNSVADRNYCADRLLAKNECVSSNARRRLSAHLANCVEYNSINHSIKMSTRLGLVRLGIYTTETGRGFEG